MECHLALGLGCYDTRSVATRVARDPGEGSSELVVVRFDKISIVLQGMIHTVVQVAHGKTTTLKKLFQDH